MGTGQAGCVFPPKNPTASSSILAQTELLSRRTAWTCLGFLVCCAVVLSHRQGVLSAETRPGTGCRMEELAELGDAHGRLPGVVQAVCAGRSLFAAVDILGNVRVWKRGSTDVLMRAIVPAGNVRYMTFASGEAELLIAGDTGLWQVLVKAATARRLLGEQILAARAEGNRLIAAVVDDIVYERAADGSVRRLGRSPARIAAVGFVRDQAAVVSKEGTLFVCEGEHWKQIQKLPQAADYAIIGGYVVCAGGAGTSLVRVPGGGTRKLKLRGAARIVRATHDGVILALSSGPQSAEFAWLCPGDKPTLQRAEIPHRCLSGGVLVDISPEEPRPQFVVAVGTTVDYNGGRAAGAVEGHRDSVRYVSFARSGCRLFSADSHMLILWDWQRRRILARRSLRRCPRLPLVSYHPRRDLVAYVRGSRKLEVERLTGNGLQHVQSYALPPGEEVSAITWLHGEAARLVVVSRVVGMLDAAVRIVRLDPQAPRAAPQLVAEEVCANEMITRVCSASPASFLTLDGRGQVSVWQLSNSQLQRIQRTSTEVLGADAMATSTCYVVGGDAGGGERAFYYDVLTPSGELMLRRGDLVYFPAAPEARDYRARLFDAAAVPGGRLLIVAGAGPVLLVDQEADLRTAHWFAAEGVITAAGVSDDGSKVAVGLSSGAVVVLQRPHIAAR